MNTRNPLRLGAALGLSLCAHLAALELSQHRPSPALTTRPPPPLIEARLMIRPPAAQVPLEAPPAGALQPGDAPAAALPGQEPETMQTSSTAETGQEQTTPGITERKISDYLPASRLSEPPRLMDAQDEGRWPRFTEWPPGRFRLKLGIDAQGSVALVVPDCEGRLCEAAAAYGETVRLWHFRPGYVAGAPVPSRIIIEFEVGPEQTGENASPDPRPPQTPFQ
ncbi:hypothetical protein [Zoogloea sp.]|uniref:energy transducer TonB n=1 Tax=Zoogloea sp. TaxID=49181 RepID=UPI002605469C|nr:hypothetical protein [Zoogloea sp.]MDD3353404.1 hypothetical protein [Zoogloea sp.]